MRVLVLGGAGYIGSVLCPYLRQRKDFVIVYDKFLYGSTKDKVEADLVIYGDICDAKKVKAAISQADVVVNLAAISNDPAADLDPRLTWDINFKANEKIAQFCRQANVRVIFASSCSVYGFSENEIFSENSQLYPVTLYAVTKMLSEKLYQEKDLDAVIFRLATVYGHSPKPRFDLVVNTMIGTSYFDGQLVVNGGDQWRPVVHVKDVAQAIYLAIHAKKFKHRIYNVGSNDQNFQIAELAKVICTYLPAVKLVHAAKNVDVRSYKVDFKKIQKDFNFKTKFTVGVAVKEINTTFITKEIINLEEDEYYRVKYLKKRLSHNIFKRQLEERYLRYMLTKQI